jgi:hypothetical protein
MGKKSDSGRITSLLKTGRQPESAAKVTASLRTETPRVNFFNCC